MNKCYLCGATDDLNLEGWIHHGRKIRCSNLRNCNRRIKKLKEKKDKNANSR